MKKIFFLPLAIVCFGFTTVKDSEIKKTAPAVTPTAGIYFYSSGLTGSAGVAADGHADEVEISSWSGAEVMALTVGGGGSIPTGRPQIAELIVDKMIDKSSVKIKNVLLGGIRTQNMELRVYNGTATAPVYKIVMTDVVVASITSAIQPCVSGACTEVHEVISLHPLGTVSWTLVTTGTTGPGGTTTQTVTYNIQTNVVS